MARRRCCALSLPVVIVFGLKFGVFTPTEAGVVAAVYALFVGMFGYRELKLAKALRRAALGGAGLRPWSCSLSRRRSRHGLDDHHRGPAGGGRRAARAVHRQPDPLMFAMMLLVVIVGTALDLIPTILILTPVLMPMVKQAGIDPVYFGVLFIMNNAIGLITPPVGTVLNVVSARVPRAAGPGHGRRHAVPHRAARRAVRAGGGARSW
ncbi:MAG: SLC13 family permease [Nitrospira sp.]